MLVFILEYGLGCLPLNLAVTAERTMCLVSLVQLSSIVPLLEQAKQAVGSIDNAALAEVRAMQAPPEAVHDSFSHGIGDVLNNIVDAWRSGLSPSDSSGSVVAASKKAGPGSGFGVREYIVNLATLLQHVRMALVSVPSRGLVTGHCVCAAG